MHQVVMLRFFAGLTIQETALALEVDSSTVARDWRVARAWLFGQLNVDGKSGDD
jgi:DNA-directed RNA polymerase specialized sigma24 family protein